MSSFIALSKRCIVFVNILNEWVGRSVAWLTLLMVMTTFTVVILRYAFDIGWIALQESVTYMHTLVFMLGAAYTLKHNAHVRVDIIHQRCLPKTRAWIDCLGTLLLLFPVSGFILWSSWEYVSDSWKILEGSRNSGGIPGLFLLKSCILTMAILLILQGLAMFLQNLFVAVGINDQEMS